MKWWMRKQAKRKEPNKPNELEESKELNEPEVPNKLEEPKELNEPNVLKLSTELNDSKEKKENTQEKPMDYENNNNPYHP